MFTSISWLPMFHFSLQILTSKAGLSTNGMTDSVPHGSVYFTSSIDSGFVTVEEIAETNSPVKIVPNKDEIIDDSVFNFRSISPSPKIFSLKKRRDKTNKHLKAFHSCVTAPTTGNLPNFDILDTPLSKYNIANKTRFKPNSTTSTTSTATATVGSSNKIIGLKDLFSNTVCLIKEEGMPNTHSTLSSEDIKNACTVIDNTIREFKGGRFKTDNISRKPHKDIEDECETHFRRKASIGMQKAKPPLCKETNLKQNDSGSVLMQEPSLDDFNMLHDCEELEHETPFCDWFDLPEGTVIDTSESSDSEVHIEDKSLVSENETLSQQTTPLTSVLKEELKFKIQYKRLKYGQPELVLQPEKPKVYKVKFQALNIQFFCIFIIANLKLHEMVAIATNDFSSLMKQPLRGDEGHHKASSMELEL